MIDTSLNDYIIVHILERVIRTKSRDSGLYSDFVIEREHVYSQPMKRSVVNTYLTKRATSPDSVIDTRYYVLVETEYV